MFRTLSAEVADRLAATTAFLTVHDAPAGAHSSQLAAYRGFAFVDLYATYEHAVRSSMQATLAGLRSTAVTYSAMRPSVLSLALSSDWDSVAAAGRKVMWERRISLIESICYGGVATNLPDTLFPADGSHYRTKQLHTIWAVLGITEPVVPENRLLGRIDELVENRNAICHGRRTAREVGRGYSRADIETRIRDTELICSHVIGTLSAHLDSGALACR